MKYLFALSALVLLSGCALNTAPTKQAEPTKAPAETTAISGLDQCTNDTDCFEQGIDTSFCSDGQWSCIQGQCHFSCSIN